MYTLSIGQQIHYHTKPMLIEYLLLLFYYPMKYINHRSHGISFYSIYSTKEISFFGPYKFLVKVSFPLFILVEKEALLCTNIAPVYFWLR